MAKTALLAWEIGEGLGHLPTLRAIAEGLSARGWRIVFALRQIESARASLASLDATLLQAPYWPNAIAIKTPSFTYADILAANGFGNAADLRSLVERWDQIFATAKPDLLICEHAPGAVCAAFGRIPTALVGNGFLMPPADGDAFPAYALAGDDALPQASILAVMREVMGARGQAPQSITEPFRGAFRGVYSFPELDPYRERRNDLVFGPVEKLPLLTARPARRNVFAYSASDYALREELAAVMMELGPKSSAYFRGAIGARAAVLRSRGVIVFDRAPALDEILPTATAVFSHAGSGFASAALAAGRPQILNPRHGEATVTAKLLEALGVGIVIDPLERTRLRESIERLHAEPAFAAAAQRAGEAAQAFVAKANAIERTLSALETAV